jgi:tetratricopeptide (TPR) repeat protein
MDFLRNLVFLALLGATWTIHAQPGSAAWQEAFSTSYRAEADSQYAQAASALIKIYDEKSYEINLRLGWLYYLQGAQEKAISSYRKASALMPAATEPWWGLVYPLAAREDWVQLEEVYQAILKLDPKNATANYRLGLIYYYRKNYTRALPHFELCLDMAPFDYDALLMNAWTQFFLGKTTNAKVLFQKVLLNRPGDVSALEGLSQIK